MKILTLNVGSSSVKYSIYFDLKLVDHKNFQNISNKNNRKKVVLKIFEKIKKNRIELDAIAHRVVHGGNITKTSVVNSKLLDEIKKASEFAPLHNLPEIEVLQLCMKQFKDSKIKQVAVFDTAYHSTLSLKSAAYPIPFSFYKKGIRKYGFHGISHRYVTRGLKGKVISCHLGNGCSICAIENGKSVDTSMGLTPLDGIMMGTRSGSLDPAVVEHLMKHGKMKISGVIELLNKKSGLLGISNLTNDMLTLLKKQKNDSKAKLAIDMFVDRIVKQIGAYVAVLNGADTLVFTAGIGENNAYLRGRICESLSFMGLKLDSMKNESNAKIISSKVSKVKVMVIPTNEESEMVLQCIDVLNPKIKK